MNNPFETINERLCEMHSLLLNLEKKVLITKPSDTETDQFLDLKDTAKFLKLKPATIYTKVSRKELPNCKRGGRLYFPLTELIDYLKKGKRYSFSEIEKQAEQYLNSNS